jgi:Na+/pantothenate symporter
VISFSISLIALIYIILGFDPNAGIFGTLVATTFSGLVVLFPATLAALYRPKTSAFATGASIVVGELSIAGFRTGLLPTFGFLDGILALGVASLVLVAGDFIVRGG